MADTHRFDRAAVKIKRAQTKMEIQEVRSLFREYEAFLDVDLCFQGFEKELTRLPGKYAPPNGALLIATDGNKAVGCVAVQELGDGVCEMKRLYVRPAYRGTGVGRQLAQKIIEAAREIGYSLMRLDTLDKLSEALHLYGTLGFRTTQSYYENPLPGVVYLALPLMEPGACRQHPAANAEKPRC